SRGRQRIGDPLPGRCGAAGRGGRRRHPGGGNAGEKRGSPASGGRPRGRAPSRGGQGGGAVTRIKICGLTTPEDARAAAAAGADMVGFVFAPSPRRVDAATAAQVGAAVPLFVLRVGVFVDADYDTLVRTAEEARLDVLRSEEHTSELQSRENLVCRLLLEKKKQ